jgi:hypothetical protein
MTEFNKLIDHSLITAAKQNLASVEARRGPAQERLAAAKRIKGHARSRHDLALAGDAAEDPVTTAAALDTASKAHDVASAAIPAIEAALARANDHLREQTGIAHQPIVTDGIAKYFAACRLAEEGRAIVEKAASNFHAAVAQIRHAATNGAHYPVGNNMEVGSPSLTKMDGVFHVPTVGEAVVRFASAAGRFPGVDGSGTLNS